MQTFTPKYPFYFIMLFCFISSCNLPIDSPEHNLTKTTDMLGRQVMIPEKIENIVALNAGMLRLIAWMDAADMVCGIEFNETRRQVPYLFAQPQLRAKSVIGTGNSPEPELLTLLAPDVIFSTYISKAEADKLQERTGIPVLAIQYGNFDDEIDTVFSALKYLGEILNRKERADYLIKYITETIGDLKIRTIDIPESEKPNVYVGGIAYRGSHGITSTEPRYPPFRFLNAKNAAASLGAVMTSEKDVLLNAFIDKEQLIEWNPDFIFLDMSGTIFHDNKSNEPWLDVLSAAKTGNIYTLFPYNWYTINYSTILVNAYFMGKVLYPKQFADINPEAKADEIYTAITGAPVYNDMVKKFGKCRKLDLLK
ncbi:MAG: ABC transporter substrate-binding protein [Bacteroidales bacterium]|nr:ABC transporter substrate-binding protein [Bacteroidales bacterium]